MSTGLGALFGGFKEGIETRNKMDFQREYTEYMRQKNELGINELQSQYDKGLATFMQEGRGTQEDYASKYGARYQRPKDPAGIRFFKMLGNKMGIGGGEEESLPPVVMNASDEEQVNRTVGVGGFAYADGGVVPRKYGCGGRVRKYEDGGKVKGPRALGDEQYLAERQAEKDERQRRRDSYEHPATDEAIDRRSMNIDSAYKRYGEAETTREKFAGARDIAGGYVLGALDVGGGAVEDTVRGIVEPVGEALGGWFGTEGGEAPAAVTPPAPKAEEQPAEEVGPPLPDAGKADATDTAVGDETPSEAIADRAVASAEEDFMKNLDFQQLAAQGVSPDQLPSMTTGEWGEWRQLEYVANIRSGMSPREAYEDMDMRVIETQMRGMDHGLMKAAALLETGNTNAAMLAIATAYQYFPNGSHVEFAAMDDPKTGRPVIVARGVSEETGEPVGTPQIITVDRIQAMRAALGNPDSWRTWTKDQRDLQLRIAQHEETVEHNRATEDIAARNADARMLEAESDARSGIAMNPEQRQRDKIFDGFMKDDVADDERLADPYVRSQLRSLMGQLQQIYPSLGPNTIYDQVYQNFRAAEEEQMGTGLAVVERLIQDHRAKAKGKE